MESSHKNTLPTLYPAQKPFDEGFITVDEIHQIYYQRIGHPEGRPIVFLHGGPGSGINDSYHGFFNPEKYHVILFDQRGAGKSQPHAELRNNTTRHLIQDIETLRERFNIENWMVFGGSWGSTLALSYAIHHADRVQALLLRGIFLCRPHELQWFYQQGASRIFPDAWQEYTDFIPSKEKHDMIGAYHRRLTSDDPVLRQQAARRWSVWEAATSKLIPDEKLKHDFSEDQFSLAFARIECHYFSNNIFFEDDNYILNNTHQIQHIPCEIVHGRYDMVCPIENAWDLHRSLPRSRLHIIEDAGHSLFEPGITKKMLELTELYAKQPAG